MTRTCNVLLAVVSAVICCCNVTIIADCFKAVDKSCPTMTPLLCGARPCEFIPNSTGCESVLNGVVQGTYNCRDNECEARVKAGTTQADCETMDNTGEYSETLMGDKVICGEFRYCLLNCAVTTQIRSQGTTMNGMPCNWKIMEAHCQTDSEGLWWDSDEWVQDMSYVACAGYRQGNCPMPPTP